MNCWRKSINFQCKFIIITNDCKASLSFIFTFTIINWRLISMFMNMALYFLCIHIIWYCYCGVCVCVIEMNWEGCVSNHSSWHGFVVSFLFANRLWLSIRTLSWKIHVFSYRINIVSLLFYCLPYTIVTCFTYINDRIIKLPIKGWQNS